MDLHLQAWRNAWWDAEREEALRVLEDELASPAAWQPAQALWGGGDADDLGGGGGAGPQEAWQAEFWPPVVAERALALVAELARKCGWLADGAARQSFAAQVPQVPLWVYHNP